MNILKLYNEHFSFTYEITYEITYPCSAVENISSSTGGGSNCQKTSLPESANTAYL